MEKNNDNKTEQHFPGFKTLSRMKFENLVEGLNMCPVHKNKTIFDIDEVGVYCKTCHILKGTRYPEDYLRKLKFKFE